MPLRLDLKKKLSARSERVKSVDFHPTEPWILAALYSGHLFIWNYSTQTLVKSIEVCELPVRCARFIPSKQWIICGSDDMNLRVYNLNTMERLKTFEAHTDYIRCLAVHPTLPYVLSSSDDMFIKLWDWEKNWECSQIYEGHTHYVMQMEFNPRDPNTFASASLDRSIKFWGLTSPVPHFSLDGHERGVNCIGFYRGGDRPYILSGADDHLVKVWDYQTKACVATLEGHSNNVSAVLFHPELPIILSGSEDGTVRIWHAATYRLENTLNYGMERVWSICCLRGSNKVAIGYDDGTIMIKIGHEEPVASMERGGKLVWANNHEIVIASVKSQTAPVDGERLTMKTKDLGSCEIYPQSLQHDPKGHFICACGDGEYIIYTALSLKNKSFGSALEFVWANDTGAFATRESTSKVKLFKDFKEAKSFRPNFAAEGIFGGSLLGVRSNEFIDFYDWSEARIIRRIDVNPRKVFWSDSGSVVVLACEASFYVLRYNDELVAKFLDQGVEVGEQGIEGSFELEQEVAEKVKAGYFVGDCFIYTNGSGRLNYYVGGETMTLAHLPKPMHLLGYLPKENRVYLMDKSQHVYSYALLLNVLVYQTAIVRRDFDGARQSLKTIPVSHYNRLARFLESQDLKELALEVSQDPEHKFELSMQCKKFDLARLIAIENESEQKWRQLGDAALNQQFNLKLAEECFTKGKDLGALLMLYSSLGDASGMEKLAELAKAQGHFNIAFTALFLLHRTSDAVQLLSANERIPEAAFMTRTFIPSQIHAILPRWKQNLAAVSTKAAEALADPAVDADKFPDLDWALKAERWANQNDCELKPAVEYPLFENAAARNLIQELKDGKLNFNENACKPQPARTPAKEPEVQKSRAADEKEVPRPATINQTHSPAPISVPVVQAAAPVPAPASIPTPVSIPSPVSVTKESAISSPVAASPSNQISSLKPQVTAAKSATPTHAPAPVQTPAAAPAPLPVVVAPAPAAVTSSSAFDDLDALTADLDVDATTADGDIPSMDDIDKSLADFDDFE